MKLLIAEACLVIAIGAEIAAHADVGDIVDVSKDDASYLARAGRAFYVSRDDDPTRGGLTANEDDKARIAKQAKAIAASQKQAAAVTGPTDFSAILRDAVAAGVAQGAALVAQQSAGKPAGA